MFLKVMELCLPKKVARIRIEYQDRVHCLDDEAAGAAA
jgi:hypothetical protein